MDVEKLQDLALLVSGERSVDAVLQRIVSGLQAQPGVALVRVWLTRPGDLCHSCRLRESCPDQTMCLHLAGSAGASLSGESWSRTDGEFRRIPIGRLKVGSIAAERAGLLITDPLSEKWGRPDWVQREHINAFIGQPFVFRDETLGVLAVFRRTAMDDHEFRWLRIFADQAAAAIANARAIAELERQRQQLELLDRLLITLGGVLDVSQVFGHVSTIAQKVINHDMVSLPLVSEDREHLIIYAVTGNSVTFPETVPLPDHNRRMLTEPWEYVIHPDLQADPLEKALPPGQAGYRGRLTVPIRLQGEVAGALDFFSFSPNCYTSADVLIARRIADHVALSLSHQRLAEEAQRAAEARERAAALERRVTVLTAEVDALGGHRRVIGESRAWKHVLKQATQVAGTDTTVLLLGESGTGKEVLARFIHRASARNSGPFVAINCAALPEQLLESELFGHERGAFTGAVTPKPGQLELAASGVLFLDEVSEMSPTAQAKFLRVLQEREFQRLGGTRVLKSNVRVIAATNRDLSAAIARGTFREDLFYRLNVFEISLTPLRDRIEDILPLSDAFLQDIGRAFGRPPAGLSRDGRQLLMDYHWPGNVRQLRNTLERAAILCEGGLITSEHLSLPARVSSAPAVPSTPSAHTTSSAAASAPPVATDLNSMERAAIAKALVDAKHNKSKAARLLGLTRTQLYVRLRKHGLD